MFGTQYWLELVTVAIIYTPRKLVHKNITFVLQYSIFNALFVIAFVIGWPVFLIVYLAHIKDRLNEETVVARIGHVYKSYDERYYYWLDYLVV